MRKLIICCIAFWAVPALAGPFKVSSPDAATKWALKFEAEFKGTFSKDTLDLPEIELKIPVRPGVELSIEAPYRSVDPSAGPAHAGPGDLEIKSKWNFYNSGKLGLAIEPELSLPTGSSSRDLGAGHATLELPLILGYRTGAWELGSELGYEHEFTTGDDSAYWGFLALRAVTPKLKLGVEVVYESPDAKLDAIDSRVNVGLKWKFGNGYELQALAGHTLDAPAHEGASLYKLAIEKEF